MAKEKINKEAEVIVAGKTVNNRPKKNSWQADSGSGIWGSIFISAGILFILTTMGGLSFRVWEVIWKYWPLILVLIGVNIVLGNNIFSKIVITLFSFFVFGMIILLTINEVQPSYLNEVPKEILNFIELFQGVKQT